MKNPFAKLLAPKPATDEGSMGIYAVRDRMLNYFMVPFAGPNDNAVLAAIAQQVNVPGSLDAIAQAPHQFEVWKIGEVTDQGFITPEHELVASCDTLIRAGVRNTGTPGGTESQNPPDRGYKPLGLRRGPTGAETGTPEDQAPATNQPPQMPRT